MSKKSRRNFVRCITGGSLLSFAKMTALGRDSIPLIVPGKRSGSIFLSLDASPSEKWAAEQLSLHLERMTGVRLPIAIGQKVPESPAIAVGRSALTDQYRLEIPEGESCLLKTEGETLILAGGRQRGTMYGVFGFLEKLGCRWLTPDITKIPRVETLSVPPLAEVNAPAFEYREVFFTEALGKEWSARNRLNGHFHQLDESVGGKISYLPFAHSFYDLLPPDHYFTDHPEYFSLVAGRRRSGHAQLCLTNADAVRISVDRVRQWLTDHPEISIISVSQNDWAGWCECDPCQRVVRDEGGATSGLLLRFVNQVAEQIGKTHPGKIIDTLAYRDTADAPATVRPLPNVQIRLCPIDACQAHSYATCIYNRRFKEQLSQWSRIAPKLYIWQYSTNFSHYLAPFPNYDQLVSDIPLFRRAGVSGLFIQGAVSEGGGGEDAELRAYILARLLWSPQTNVPSEIRDFLEAVYGPAAQTMWRYFALRHREVRRGEHLWIDQNVDAPYLTKRFLKEGRDLLHRASLKAVTPAARRRIERCLLSIDYVETMRGQRYRIRNGSYAPDDLGRVKLETQNLVRKAQELGLSHLREAYPLGQQSRDYDELMRDYPVVSLSDGVLAARVVPDLEARIVVLGRVGSSTNVLRAPDTGEWAYPRAGGLFVRLYSSYMSSPDPLLWRTEVATHDALTLAGKSERGLLLRMQIRFDSNALGVHVVVENSTRQPMPVAVLCRAELSFGASRVVQLSYHSGSGVKRSRRFELGDQPTNGAAVLAGDERPEGEWTLTCPDSTLRLRNSFRTEEVSRCVLSWSFRGSTHLDLNLWSPESELSSGQQLLLSGEYALI